RAPDVGGIVFDGTCLENSDFAVVVRQPELAAPLFEPPGNNFPLEIEQVTIAMDAEHLSIISRPSGFRFAMCGNGATNGRVFAIALVPPRCWSWRVTRPRSLTSTALARSMRRGKSSDHW